jgi:Flagellar hook-length control protein FliK
VDAIHLPNAVTLPTTFGAPGTPLPPGQLVQALVLELIESDVFRLQLPQATVDVRADVALTPGSTVTVATKGTAANARLVIYSDDARPAASSGPSAPASSANAAPSVAGKHPIGEAVIIGRVAPGTSAKAQAAPGEAAIRDAASISPAARPNPARIEAPRVEAPILTPQQALGKAVRTAAARQSGLAPLLADAEQAMQLPPGAMPPPVRAAAAQVLALRVPLSENLTAADVKQAFVRSGVLFEAKVAESRAPASPGAAGPNVAAPGNDLKAALIVFRQVLKVWSGEAVPDRTPSLPSSAPPAASQIARPAPSDAASIKQLASVLAGTTSELLVADPLSPEQAASLAKSVAAALHGREAPPEPVPGNPNGPPPPYRGASLSAQQPSAPSIVPDTPPHEAAERLLGATDGAIARTTLLQAASLPEQSGAQRLDQGAPRWTFEIPFMTPQGTGVAQFEVSRDGGNAKSEAPGATWRARFSLDLEPMGPVHAMIALSGARASVTLWAERPGTAAQLNENAPLLNQALRAAELEPADFQFRVGTPPVVAKQATPGRFMDRAT